MAATYVGDLDIYGTLAPRALTAPSGCIGDSSVAAAANIAASKLEHNHRLFYGQAYNATVSSHTSVLFIARNTTGEVKRMAGQVATVATASANATTCVAYRISAGATTSNEIGTLNLGATNHTAQTIATCTLSTATSLAAGDSIVLSVTQGASTAEVKGLQLYIDVYEDGT